MRCSGSAKSDRQTEEVLLGQMPEPLVGKASETGALVIRKDEDLPGLREGVPLRQGHIPTENLLQSCLRQQIEKGWWRK